MRALVYHGPGKRVWEEVNYPEITDEGDVIVRADATTICGTDLHILAGDVPEVRQGRILGHEAVGTVHEVGGNVHRLSPGDRVLVSCISGCGTCRFCREGRYGQCLEGGGWVLGHRIDGTQADYVRRYRSSPKSPARSPRTSPRSSSRPDASSPAPHGRASPSVGTAVAGGGSFPAAALTRAGGSAGRDGRTWTSIKLG